MIARAFAEALDPHAFAAVASRDEHGTIGVVVIRAEPAKAPAVASENSSPARAISGSSAAARCRSIARAASFAAA